MLDCDMPLAQYRHNKKFITHGIHNCEGYDFRDWIVTAYFYATLHLVQHVLIKECGVAPANHKKRNECMIDNRKIFNVNHIMRDYSNLKMFSQLSRYDQGASIDNGDVLKALACMENLEYELKKYIAETDTTAV